MNFLRHPAWLWLSKNDKYKLPPFDAATQARFDAGNLFESYAEKLFSDGLKLNKEGSNWYQNLLLQTEEAIFTGAKTILQARFLADDITCICDVIKFVGEKQIDLYEIKSSSSVNASHYPDLAFQTIVLEDCGYVIRNIAVIHVNKEYVRRGQIDTEKLTKVTDVTDKVKKRLNFTRENIKIAIKTAKQPEIPNMSPSLCGLSCTTNWLEIYKTINGIDKGDGSVYDIYSPSATLIGKLEAANITRIDDIPEDFAGLSEKQRWQIKALKQNKIFIDSNKIKQFLGKIEYPIYFLDYETLSSVIPYFDGHKPSRDVPFQYSLHTIDKPGAEVQHTGYLHKENSDPALPLSESLKQNIGVKGTILVWWESMEKGCNASLAEIAPEYKKFYEDLNTRIIDLIIPFFCYYYVDKRFNGSASIKDVLPVLVPELNHKNLDISEGLLAQRLWMDAVLDNNRPNEKEKILKDLWDYCKLDTLAMVEIYKILSRL
jgi:hypothetical protein